MKKSDWISTHALREEGDEYAEYITGKADISTHALREEGDSHAIANIGRVYDISTHALREEGDLMLDSMLDS